MAGIAGLFNPGQKAILVAICPEFQQVLRVAAGFTLDPQTFPRTRPICHASGCHGPTQGFAVHPSHH